MKPPEHEDGGPVSRTAAIEDPSRPKPERNSASVNASDLEDITLEESRDLVRLEKVIDGGLQTFLEVGAALAEIRDRRLYRIEHKTFEAYCRDKWSIGRTYAHRIMAAAETVEMLPMGNKPTSERQARPLTKIPAENRVEAWQRAVERADGGQPTTADVEAVVEEVKVDPVCRPVVKIDAADRIWAVAKGHLDKITEGDESLPRVLDEVAAYCQRRKIALGDKELKKARGNGRRLTFGFGGMLQSVEPWKDGEPMEATITFTASSKSMLQRHLGLLRPKLADAVWHQSSARMEERK
jgi:hypothetical protein